MTASMELADRFLQSPPSGRADLLMLTVLVALAGGLALLSGTLRRVALPAQRRLLVAAAVAAALLVLEGAAWWCDRLQPGLFIPEARRLWTLNPGFAGRPRDEIFGATPWIAINSLGMRSPEAPLRKPPGVTRILVLGDSCPFGQFVLGEEAFPAVLEGKLAASRRAAVQVVNAAVPGYATWQGLDLYRRAGEAMEPALLVIAFNNDSMRDTAEDRARAPGPVLERLLSLLYRSRLYLHVRRAAIDVRRQTERPGAPAGEPVPRVSPGDFRTTLAALIEEARGRGAKVLVVGLPLRAQRSGERGAFFENPEGARAYREIMRDAAEGSGASYCDLAPLWTKEKLDAHMIDFCHPDAKGHRRIGEHLARFIEEKELLP